MLACTVQPFYFYCWYRSYYNVISYKLRTGKIETKNTNFMFPEKDFRYFTKIFKYIILIKFARCSLVCH